MFYVYEVSIVTTGEIIYVGKGTGNRYKTKKVNKLLNRLIQDNECEIKKTKYFNTEEEAFEAERLRILELKAIGQAICNKATYTTGGIASYWSEERRKEMSINNPMKDIKQRERMSKFNPMKDKETAKVVKEKLKLSFIIGDKEYKGLSEAAEEYNVTNACVSYWLKRGYDNKGQKCYKVKPNKEVQVTNLVNNHTIIYDGKEYLTKQDLSKVVNRTEGTINIWLSRGYSPEGIECRYKDDLVKHKCILFKRSNFTKKPILVDGVMYESIKVASKHTGYTTNQLCYYLKDAKNPPVKCEYANQQPS